MQRALGAAPPRALLEELLARYREPHRAYLERPNIYATPRVRAEREARARENLTRSIAKLGG